MVNQIETRTKSETDKVLSITWAEVPLPPANFTALGPAALGR
jgi:hypothetical protein